MTSRTKKASRRSQRRLVERKQGACLFCEHVRGLTWQHVFDNWLGNLGLGGDGLRELVEFEPGRRILQPGGPFGKKLKIVCEPCNGIWLSGMEKAAKDLLLAMFRGDRRVELNGDAQLALARWAFKTVCVLSQLGSEKTFPLDHCHQFRQSSLPSAQAQVWVGSASVRVTDQRAAIVETFYTPRIANMISDGRTVMVQCYSVRLRLLNVVFDVFGHAPVDGGWSMRADLSENLQRALLPIWPAENSTIWWPPVTSLDSIGGVAGLAKVPLVGVPTLIPPVEKSDTGP